MSAVAAPALGAILLPMCCLDGVYTPKVLAGTEIEIAGKWYPLPSLKFGKNVPISLLGRDLVFLHFELRMTSQAFELRPRHARRTSKRRSRR